MQLAKVERALAALVDAIPPALELDGEATRLENLIDPGKNHREGARGDIEYRLAHRLGEVGMRDLTFVRGRTRTRSLGTPVCAVCRHPEREAIDAARAAGEPLSAIGDRFGVSKSTLSRHGGH